MARRATILGIWVLAAAFGGLGYQLLTYWFYHRWPPLTVAYLWGLLVGPWPAADAAWAEPAVAWCGRLPVLAVGIALAYLCFLIADTVQRPATVHRPVASE